MCIRDSLRAALEHALVELLEARGARPDRARRRPHALADEEVSEELVRHEAALLHLQRLAPQQEHVQVEVDVVQVPADGLLRQPCALERLLEPGQVARVLLPPLLAPSLVLLVIEFAHRRSVQSESFQ